MAVFTPVTREQLGRWLDQYNLGRVVDFRGIPSGIENTNFFLTMENGRGNDHYVLTLFERLSADQLPFYLELMRHLAEHSVPCPAPIPTRNGKLFATLNDKPAAIVTKLPGRSVAAPSIAQCRAVGDALARMHLAGKGFDADHPDLRGLSWWQATVPLVLDHLDEENRLLLTNELAYQGNVLPGLLREIPSGPIHADLFRDNVLFEGSREEPRLGGLIDFYFAGSGAWLYDVAICVNDWCIDTATGELDAHRLEALLQGYAAMRPFTESERGAWNTLLRAAALRFWLSRLWDFHLPRPAEMLTPHDPGHFERVLRLRRSVASTLQC